MRVLARLMAIVARLFYRSRVGPMAINSFVKQGCVREAAVPPIKNVWNMRRPLKIAKRQSGNVIPLSAPIQNRFVLKQKPVMKQLIAAIHRLLRAVGSIQRSGPVKTTVAKALGANPIMNALYMEHKWGVQPRKNFSVWKMIPAILSTK